MRIPHSGISEAQALEKSEARANAELIAKAPIAPKLAEALRAAIRIIPKSAMNYSKGDHGERIYIRDQAIAALAEWDNAK